MQRDEAPGGEQFGQARTPLWVVVALVTLYAFYAGMAGEQTLWLQALPVALAGLMAGLATRSRRGLVAFVAVALLMVYVCWMRIYGGY